MRRTIESLLQMDENLYVLSSSGTFAVLSSLLNDNFRLFVYADGSTSTKNPSENLTLSC